MKMDKEIYRVNLVSDGIQFQLPKNQESICRLRTLVDWAEQETKLDQEAKD